MPTAVSSGPSHSSLQSYFSHNTNYNINLNAFGSNVVIGSLTDSFDGVSLTFMGDGQNFPPFNPVIHNIVVHDLNTGAPLLTVEGLSVDAGFLQQILQYGPYPLTPQINSFLSPITFNGSAADETFDGTPGGDAFYSGGGHDIFSGGDGNDAYFDPGQSTLIEPVNGGTDLVLSSQDYVLPANIENLTLTEAAGSFAEVGEGNASANQIYGNTLDNILSGDAGNDTLYAGPGADKLFGGSGADILDGGDGADEMTGGTGSDIYYVDDTNDVIVEED